MGDKSATYLPDLVIRHGREDGKTREQIDVETADLIARSYGEPDYREGRARLENTLIENGMNREAAAAKAAHVARKHVNRKT